MLLTVVQSKVFSGAFNARQLADGLVIDRLLGRDWTGDYGRPRARGSAVPSGRPSPPCYICSSFVCPTSSCTNRTIKMLLICHTVQP